jgi:hypothetical protein
VNSLWGCVRAQTHSQSGTEAVHGGGCYCPHDYSSRRTWHWILLTLLTIGLKLYSRLSWKVLPKGPVHGHDSHLVPRLHSSREGREGWLCLFRTSSDTHKAIVHAELPERDLVGARRQKEGHSLTSLPGPSLGLKRNRLSSVAQGPPDIPAGLQLPPGALVPGLWRHLLYPGGRG